MKKAILCFVCLLLLISVFLLTACQKVSDLVETLTSAAENADITDIGDMFPKATQNPSEPAAKQDSPSSDAVLSANEFFYEPLYQAKRLEYQQAWNTGNENMGVNYMVYQYGCSVKAALYDIDGNGIPELIFADGADCVIDLYTASEKGGLIWLFEEGGEVTEREEVWILDDGQIVRNGATSASESSIMVYAMNADGDHLEYKEGYYYYTDSDSGKQQSSYWSLSDDWQSHSVNAALDWTMLTPASHADAKNDTDPGIYARILPYADRMSYTEEEIQNSIRPWIASGYSMAAALRLARNEIYADHGAIFNDDALTEYYYGERSDLFGSAGIYPSEIVYDMFNDYEKQNVHTIKQMEKELK